MLRILTTTLILSLCVSTAFAQTPSSTSSSTPSARQEQKIDEYNDALSGKDPLEREPTPPAENTKEIKAESPPVALPSQDRKILGMIEYAPFDLFIPSKFGASAGWRFNKKTSVELEYLRGALSVPFLFDALGGMTDQRFGLFLRSHFGKTSFNYHYGFSYHMFKIRLGSEIVNRAVPHSSDIDEIALDSFGFVVGLGNRWVIADNIIVGIDWFVWSQPIAQTRRKLEFMQYVSSSDRDRLNKAIDFVSDFPRLSVLKFNLGMTF